MKVIPFSYKDHTLYYPYLKPYKLAKDYKYLCSSKEWIMAYLETFKPTKNYLFTNEHNYFILTETNGSLHFCGGEFNDFNGINNIDTYTEFNMESLFIEIKKIQPSLSLTNVFEDSIIDLFDRGSYSTTKTQSISIIRYTSGSFAELISKRIRKMYFKYQDRLSFQRIYAKDFSDTTYRQINYMLKRRQEKLIKYHGDNRNLSFNNHFNDFIMRIISNKDIHDEFFIDVAYEEDVPVGMSWNFVHNGNIICYLRSHANGDNKISYGLILDYWSAIKNDEESIMKWDFTRGTENYKYRLGGVEYLLNNFKIA